MNKFTKTEKKTIPHTKSRDRILHRTTNPSFNKHLLIYLPRLYTLCKKRNNYDKIGTHDIK